MSILNQSKKLLLQPLIVIAFVLLNASVITLCKEISVPGEIPFSVKLLDDSAKDIRNWVKNGGKSRIKIHIQYSSEFGFPVRCDANGREVRNTLTINEEKSPLRDGANGAGANAASATAASASATSATAAGVFAAQSELVEQVVIPHAQIIFHWCHWDWGMSNRRGIWDTDFRFEAYALGLTLLDGTTIKIQTDFHANATKENKW